MTVKEYIDAIVKLSAEHTEAVEQLKKAVDELIEQHKPAEPLIKDEKVRKAVRAWAEINGIDKVKYVAYGGNEYTLIYEKIDVNLWIQFERSIVEFGKLVDYQFYTIAELCGEEEE